MNNKHCWVYYDTYMDDLVLVQKPHRRSIKRRYSCVVYEWTEYKIIVPDVHGNIPDKSVIVDNVRDCFTLSRKAFKSTMVYLGGLNHNCEPNNFKVTKVSARVYIQGEVHLV